MSHKKKDKSFYQIPASNTPKKPGTVEHPTGLPRGSGQQHPAAPAAQPAKPATTGTPAAQTLRTTTPVQTTPARTQTPAYQARTPAPAVKPAVVTPAPNPLEATLAGWKDLPVVLTVYAGSQEGVRVVLTGTGADRIVYAGTVSQILDYLRGQTVTLLGKTFKRPELAPDKRPALEHILAEMKKNYTVTLGYKAAQGTNAPAKDQKKVVGLQERISQYLTEQRIGDQAKPVMGGVSLYISAAINPGEIRYIPLEERLH